MQGISQELSITTEDNVELLVGARAYNYYDMQSGRISRINTVYNSDKPNHKRDIWFDFKHDEGGMTLLNGERICSLAFAAHKGWRGAAGAVAMARAEAGEFDQVEPEPTKVFRSSTGQTGIDAYIYEAGAIANAYRDLNIKAKKLRDAVMAENHPGSAVYNAAANELETASGAGDFVEHMVDHRKDNR